MPQLPGKFHGSAIECVPINLIIRNQYKCDHPSKNCLCRDANTLPGEKEVGGDREEETAERSKAVALIEQIRERREEPLIILIDMDNTLNDWDRQFRRLCAYYYPMMGELSVSDRVHYHMELNLDSKPELAPYRSAPLEFTELEGFWREMPLAPGAYEALMEMLELGLTIFIVSKPDGRFLARSCQEKANWLERNFGDSFKSKLILCSDKTLVHGDILIDDNPKASVGAGSPSWKHVFFCQPYNTLKGGKGEEHKNHHQKIHNWKTWKQDLIPILQQIERERDKGGSHHKDKRGRIE